MDVLGLDIGSSGVTGCIVDTVKGELISETHSTPELKDTSPPKVLSRMHEVVKKHFKWDGPVGCAFPASIRRGIVLAANRIDPSWTDADAEQLFSEITDNPVSIINDTDAIGIAEMNFGSGAKHNDGLVIVLTVGTGVGSSLFMNSRLIPNTELGLIELRGMTVAERASDKARKEQGLGKKAWAKRLQEVLEFYEKIFHPDLFILGGALSQKAKKVFPYIKINTSFKPFELQNDASIIGAAIVAANKDKRREEFFH